MAVYLVTQIQALPEKPPSLNTMVRMVASLGRAWTKKVMQVFNPVT